MLAHHFNGSDVRELTYIQFSHSNLYANSSHLTISLLRLTHASIVSYLQLNTRHNTLSLAFSLYIVAFFYVMGIKKFVIFFIITSILLTLFFIPTILTRPNSITQLTDIAQLPQHSKPFPVSFAYLISASKGDIGKLKRVLRALYHPSNYYLLHLDLDADPTERRSLSEFVAQDPVFVRFDNVWIVGKSNLITYRGPTMLANTLHAMSILLKTCNWDWFINLSASDYPLVTQDDLIHAFSNLPRYLNFVQHTSHLGWKLTKRAKPIMIDPGLYSLNKSEIVWATEQRTLPTAFKLYTGSAWMMLSRSFSEYCILAWDNLPRTLLLYYANFISSPEGYFQTLICNSKNYRNTTVNHDLHYIVWDTPPKQHPRSLGLKDYRRLILSNAPFARKFKKDDPVLDKIDHELLRRKCGGVMYGGWCLKWRDRFGSRTDAIRDGTLGMIQPGAGAKRLKVLISKMINKRNFKRRQCA